MRSWSSTRSPATSATARPTPASSSTRASSPSDSLGLHLVVDLGAWWLETTGLPLPLGGNCIRKDLGREAMQEVTDILKQSIQFSLDHRAEAVKYALQFGRDLDRNWRTNSSACTSTSGRSTTARAAGEAIDLLLQRGAEAGLVPDAGPVQYVTAR